jgi:hypothetical protein
MNVAAISHLADIEPVLEDVGERTNHESPRGNTRSACEASRLRLDAFSIQRCCQSADRTKAQIVSKDLPDEVSLLRDDLQLLVDAAIPERDRTTDPDSLARSHW